jgi:hypothetical protein
MDIKVYIDRWDQVHVVQEGHEPNIDFALVLTEEKSTQELANLVRATSTDFVEVGHLAHQDGKVHIPDECAAFILHKEGQLMVYGLDGILSLSREDRDVSYFRLVMTARTNKAGDLNVTFLERLPASSGVLFGFCFTLLADFDLIQVRHENGINAKETICAATIEKPLLDRAQYRTLVVFDYEMVKVQVNPKNGSIIVRSIS